MEKTNVFLGTIKPDTQCTKPTLVIRNGLPRDINAEIPTQYRLCQIADTICIHSLIDKGVGLDTEKLLSPTSSLPKPYMMTWKPQSIE